ncbi:NADH:flavin oxidoreductase, partial [Rhizobium johnstonii]
RIEDTYELIEHLIDGGVDYIHASLTSVLEAQPLEAIADQPIAELIAARVAGRIPVIAAGQIKSPQQAESALHLGLSLVAVGQGLVINPEWVELSRSGKEKLIENEIRTT